MTYVYSAFGHHLHSEVVLDELDEVTNEDVRPSIRILRTDLGITLKARGEAASYMDFENSGGVLMVWHGVCAVLIENNETVHVQTYPGITDSYLAFPLLGPVMGWVLDQRGYLVLHASAVDFAGRTMAFLGDKGAGKSTTGAACVNAGAQLITDDLLVMDCGETNETGVDDIPKKAPRILRGFGQMKLNNDASDGESIHGAEALPLIFEGFPKRQFRLENMAAPVLPCDNVFILRRTDGPLKVEWLDPTQSLGPIFRFCYNVRFTDVPGSLRNPARHFRNCAHLARSAHIGIVDVPHARETLQDVVVQLRDLAEAARP